MKTAILILLMVLLSVQAYAQDVKTIVQDSWYKISPEFRLNIPHKKLEFRYRPMDYTFPFANWRMDFMAGRLIGPFKVFLYLKADKALDRARQRTWGGVRFDYNFIGSKNRLVMNFQYRYFLALNDQTLPQQYLVQFMSYRLLDKFSSGILGFARKDRTKTPIYFLGPLLRFRWSRRYQTLIAFTKDLVTDGQYLGFIRQNIVFNMNK